jgi:hypothetical protein
MADFRHLPQAFVRYASVLISHPSMNGRFMDIKRARLTPAYWGILLQNSIVFADGACS